MSRGPIPPHRLVQAQTGVVLIEDHPVVRAQVARQLTDAGMTVLATAANADDGYRAVRALVPQVVVVDNHLPDGLGIDLCRRLHRECPQVRAVLYSAHVSGQDRITAQGAGVDAVVPKSFSGDELIAAIVTVAPAAAGPGRSPI